MFYNVTNITTRIQEYDARERDNSKRFNFELLKSVLRFNDARPPIFTKKKGNILTFANIKENDNVIVFDNIEDLQDIEYTGVIDLIFVIKPKYQHNDTAFDYNYQKI